MENLIPRPVTHEPGFHWFGYYDKQQFDPSERFLLGMETFFEHRRPEPDDEIAVGMIDLHEDDKWIPLGRSSAWCWQSGCMLQWRPGFDNQIMWNDRQKDRFVTRILDFRSGIKEELPFAFFTVHPSGESALSLDFERLEYMRPGYGYAGIQDRNNDIMAPDDMGIYRLDLQTGKKNLILSLEQITQVPLTVGQWKDAKHYVNCLLFNTSGTRFVFLHRWRMDRGKGWPFKTRMMIADSDGSNLSVLVPGGCGHFNWRDDQHLIVQEGGFSIYKDGVGRVGKIGSGILPDSGGHISYFPKSKWLVGDTYPDEKRNQQLYFFNTETGKFVDAGSFYLSPEYSGCKSGTEDNEWRCDLHPRISRSGRFICIDSAHSNGRQMYLFDASGLLD